MLGVDVVDAVDVDVVVVYYVLPPYVVVEIPSSLFSHRITMVYIYLLQYLQYCTYYLPHVPI